MRSEVQAKVGRGRTGLVVEDGGEALEPNADELLGFGVIGERLAFPPCLLLRISMVIDSRRTTLYQDLAVFVLEAGQTLLRVVGGGLFPLGRTAEQSCPLRWL